MNHQEIEDIITYIEDHPDEWHQLTWARKFRNRSCGSAYCLAGHAVVRAGYKINWQRHSSADTCRDKDGTLHCIRDVAQEVLGLDEGQASWLFAGFNTIDDLKRIAKAFRNGESTADLSWPQETNANWGQLRYCND